MSLHTSPAESRPKLLSLCRSRIAASLCACSRFTAYQSVAYSGDSLEEVLYASITQNKVVVATLVHPRVMTLILVSPETSSKLRTPSLTHSKSSVVRE